MSSKRRAPKKPDPFPLYIREKLNRILILCPHRDNGEAATFEDLIHAKGGDSFYGDEDFYKIDQELTSAKKLLDPYEETAVVHNAGRQPLRGSPPADRQKL